MAETAYIGLGSNLGDRQAFLEAGLEGLAQLPGLAMGAVSSVYETEPQGYTEQPLFLNAAAALETSLSPEELLDHMLQIENLHQRQRTIHWGPRTLDLDLLLYGNHTRRTRTLVLPHPHLTERCFVLAPLCEIAPSLVHPCTGQALAAHYQSCNCSHQLQKIGPL